MIDAARLSNWDDRLTAHLRAAGEAVQAGEDMFCAMFGAGAVEALTGVDPTADYRGRYAEVRDNLEAVIDGLVPIIPKALAQRGDLAWHEGNVGVVIGGDALFVGTVNDIPCLVRVARADWEKAWGVGHG